MFQQARDRASSADRADWRLVCGLLVSLLLHGIVLLLQFGVPGLGAPGAPQRLSVRIANADNTPPPPVPLPGVSATTPAPAPALVPAPGNVTGMRLVDPAQAPPAAPAPPAVKARPLVKKDERRRAKRISAPLPNPEKLVEAPRVIAQDATLNDFSVPLAQPEEAKEKTIDQKEAQHGEDDGNAADSAALEAEAARTGKLKAEEDARALKLAKAEDQRAADEKLRLAVREQELKKQAEADQQQAQAAQAERARADEQQRQALQLAQSQQLKAEQEAAAQRQQQLAHQQKADEDNRERLKVELARLEQQKNDRLKAQQQRAEQAEQQRAEQQRAQQQKAEQQRIADQKAADQKAADQKAADQKAADQKAADQKAADQKAADQKAVDQKVADHKAADHKAADQKEGDQRGRELAGTQPGNTGAGGSASGAGAGGPGSSGQIPKNMMGSDLANRAKDLVRGLDVLRGAAPLVRGRGERRAVVGASERDLPLKMYVESWRQKIERNGAINYPRSWADTVRIDPVVSVAVRSDGSIEDVTILSSSGNPDMDEAARRIVRVNARYSPFPPNIAERYDVIEIRRVWRFGDALKLMEEVH